MFFLSHNLHSYLGHFGLFLPCRIISVHQQPPKPLLKAKLTSGTCRPSALPITCIAASAHRIRPVAPMGLVAITPPEGLIGSSPPMSVLPSQIYRGASPGPTRPMSSIQIRPPNE